MFLSEDNKPKNYQFIRRRTELINLCALWQSSLDGLRLGDNLLPAWGPSDEDILTADVERYTDNVAFGGLADELSDDEADEGDVDPTYFAALDAINMADAFRADIGTGELDIVDNYVDADDPFQ